MTRLVLREPDLGVVLLAYVDDGLLVVQDPGNLVRVEACQAIYLVASSTWVSWVKSSGLKFGEGWQASFFPPMLPAIQWSTGLLLYLGVNLSAINLSPLEN